MRITATALSLNVEDVDASAAFVRDHFGFAEEMSADGFVALSHPDAGSTSRCGAGRGACAPSAMPSAGTP